MLKLLCPYVVSGNQAYTACAQNVCERKKCSLQCLIPCSSSSSRLHEVKEKSNVTYYGNVLVFWDDHMKCHLKLDGNAVSYVTLSTFC